MPEVNSVREPVVITYRKPRMVRDNVKPYTKINVKPYVIIKREGAVLCGGGDELPLVFDNMKLAEGFASINGFEACELKTISMEELIHMCRNPKINFNSFYLIDHKSQIV